MELPATNSMLNFLNRSKSIIPLLVSGILVYLIFFGEELLIVYGFRVLIIPATLLLLVVFDKEDVSAEEAEKTFEAELIRLNLRKIELVDLQEESDNEQASIVIQGKLQEIEIKLIKIRKKREVIKAIVNE